MKRLKRMQLAPAEQHLIIFAFTAVLPNAATAADTELALREQDPAKFTASKVLVGEGKHGRKRK